MTKRRRMCATAAWMLILGGIVFDILPRNWIELRLGFAPDGGSGLLEVLLMSVPVLVGVGLALLVLRSGRSRSETTNTDPTALRR